LQDKTQNCHQLSTPQRSEKAQATELTVFGEAVNAPEREEYVNNMNKFNRIFKGINANQTRAQCFLSI
jgi:hypothetical protein